MDLPANTRFCFLRDQEPLTDTEFRLATKQCERIRSLIESRGDDLPQGIWSGTDPELYSSTRAVLDGEYDTINNLRLFAQNFTGYQLSSLSNAAGKPTTQPNLGTIDATLEELWRVPSKENEQHLQLYARLRAIFQPTCEFLRRADLAKSDGLSTERLSTLTPLPTSNGLPCSQMAESCSLCEGRLFSRSVQDLAG